jgi:hypothetical protein
MEYQKSSQFEKIFSEAADHANTVTKEEGILWLGTR